MNTSYQYPEAVNQDDQFTPELMLLWLDAMKELEQKRNSAIFRQVLIFVVPSLIALLIFGPFIIFPGFFILVAFGVLGQAITPTYDYVVSNERNSAKFILSYKYNYTKIIADLIKEFRVCAAEDMRGLIIAVLALITFPVWGCFLCLMVSFGWLNEIWWLKGFKAWTERLQRKVAGDDSRQHIRGTNILPSVQLSGSSPDLLPPEPLEIADGNVTLLPDGGIVIQGGATFDRNSTFGNFSVNGVTLTRESNDLLTVSHKGSESSFRFDGNSWTEA